MKKNFLKTISALVLTFTLITCKPKADVHVFIYNYADTYIVEVVAKKAKDANIPIIFFYREVSNEVIRSYDEAVYVGTNPDAAGYMQGELVADEVLKNPTKWDKNADFKFNYVMLRAGLDEPEGNGRTKFSVLEVANWDTAKAKTATANTKLVQEVSFKARRAEILG